MLFVIIDYELLCVASIILLPGFLKPFTIIWKRRKQNRNPSADGIDDILEQISVKTILKLIYQCCLLAKHYYLGVVFNYLQQTWILLELKLALPLFLYM